MFPLLSSLFFERDSDDLCRCVCMAACVFFFSLFFPATSSCPLKKKKWPGISARNNN